MTAKALSEKGIENKANIEKDENDRNPLLNVRHWFIDLAFSFFKQLPFISIERRGKLLFKLVNDFEFHRIQASIVLNE